MTILFSRVKCERSRKGWRSARDLEIRIHREQPFSGAILYAKPNHLWTELMYQAQPFLRHHFVYQTKPSMISRYSSIKHSPFSGTILYAKPTICKQYSCIKHSSFSGAILYAKPNHLWTVLKYQAQPFLSAPFCLPNQPSINRTKVSSMYSPFSCTIMYAKPNRLWIAIIEHHFVCQTRPAISSYQIPNKNLTQATFCMPNQTNKKHKPFSRAILYVKPI